MEAGRMQEGSGHGAARVILSVREAPDIKQLSCQPRGCSRAKARALPSTLSGPTVSQTGTKLEAASRLPPRAGSQREATG